MSKRQLRREIAFLESRLDYNLYRMGMLRPGGAGQSPAIQNNLFALIAGSFLGGAVLGVATKEVDLEQALPLVSRL
ncbi:MAG: hypothetical protein WDZ76_10235 [Pseudohongiellaceae bacterium]